MAENKLVHGYNANLQAFGQSGFDYQSGAGSLTAHTYVAVTTLESSVISTVSSFGDNLSTVEIPAGLTIYGLFTEITVDSGKLLAYRLA